MASQSKAVSSPGSSTRPFQSGPVLTIDRVSKVFSKRGEEFVALSDVSVDLHQGEFLSLVGPSGCGKSTLLKIVAGLMSPTTGRVRFEGTPMVEPRAEIGLMFQTSTLFPWRNVTRNISLPFEITHIDDIDIDQRIAEVIDLVRLKGFEEHYPRELSGGMQQRVALCRLLVSDPHLMLLDEPFGSVDEFTREYLNQELARITEHEHKTALFVTHNIREAVFLSDRVVVMGTDPGRVLDILDIDLPRPRVPESQRLPAYNETVLKVRDLMGLI